MQWFYDLKTRAKLLLGTGVLVLALVAVAGVGYRALGHVNGYLTRLHDEQFAVALSIAEMSSNLNAVRATLLGMMSVKERGTQDTLHAQIKQLTEQIDGTFDRLLADPAVGGPTRARLRDLREPWQAFRNTRDGQLVPAIYEGRIDEARALATGIQAERYRSFSTAARGLIAEARAQALQFKQEGEREHRASVVKFILLCAFAVLAGVAIAFLYARALAAPLVTMAAVIREIERGDLTRRLVVRSHDEVGQLAHGFNVFVEKLHLVIGEARRAASSVTDASQELASAAEQISSGALQQASSLEETAASLEEITATVRHNADNAKQANEIASGSSETAENGGRVVKEAVSAMAGISDASNRIVEIINVIDEIAFQTNLLALNAAVEAARAGDQGRGFAVVAGEVRNLAQRSASAAKEIKALINDSVRQIGDGAKLVTRSGDTLEEMVRSVKRMSALIAEIATASAEQAAGIDQVNVAVTQMDQVTQSNAAQTEKLSSTAQALSGQARDLQDLVARFTVSEGAAVAPRKVCDGVPLPALPSPRRPRVERQEALEPVTAVAANGTRAHGTNGFQGF